MTAVVLYDKAGLRCPTCLARTRRVVDILDAGGDHVLIETCSTCRERGTGIYATGACDDAH